MDFFLALLGAVNVTFFFNSIQFYLSRFHAHDPEIKSRTL